MSTGGQVFGSKCEGMAAVRSQVFHNIEKGQPGVGERGPGAMYEPEAAGDFQFRHSNLHQFFAGELGLDSEAGNQRDTLAARHEALDGLEAGQLNAHVERGLVASEGFDHALAERRRYGVGDEILGAQLADGDLFLLRQRVLWVDDEDHGVGVDGDGVETRVLGAEGKDAKLDSPLQQLIGNLAGERSLHGDSDLGEIAAELVEHGKEPQAGVFVGGEGEAAALQGA